MKTTQWSKMLLVGMAAMVLVFGLVLVGCPTGDDDDKGGPHDGTYTDAAGTTRVVLSGSSFTSSMIILGPDFTTVAKGTFSVSGTSITITVTQMMGESGTLTALPNPQIMTGTISSDGKTITVDGTTYTKS
ncbi:hypothetical protein AGMMS4952_06090 [Spirochaetia bacterium]|nr:hypothetical protein AGMMS4952_06090 [Spirochaetia bacterium]